MIKFFEFSSKYSFLNCFKIIWSKFFLFDASFNDYLCLSEEILNNLSFVRFHCILNPINSYKFPTI